MKIKSKKSLGIEKVYDFSVIKNHNAVLKGSNTIAHNCNTHIYFDVQGDKLNMTVCNRSNDLIYGAPSANAAHFSYLLQYIAIKCDLKIGSYYQITNNGHIYVDEEKQKRSLKIYNKLLELCNFRKIGLFLWFERIIHLRLNNGIFNVYKFLSDLRSDVGVNLLEKSDWDFGSKEFDEDLKEFFSKNIKYYIDNLEEFKLKTFKSEYFNWIIKPLLIAFIMHKEHKNIMCTNYVYECKQEDIRIACAQWLLRRYGKNP